MYNVTDCMVRYLAVVFTGVELMTQVSLYLPVLGLPGMDLVMMLLG